MTNNARDEKWIDWSGGKCPLPKGAICDVKYRNGKVAINLPANENKDGSSVDAGPAFWRHDGIGSDIIAYRYKIKEPVKCLDNAWDEPTPEEEEAWQAKEREIDIDKAIHPDLQWLSDNVSNWGGSEDYPFIGLWSDPDRPVYSAFKGKREVWTRDQWKTARSLRGLGQPEEDEAWQAKDQKDVVPKWWKGHKQARYLDRNGRDWIDEFAETATIDEFRGAMRFTIGKYNRRAGKKDELVKEIEKMRDYCERWLAYEAKL